MSKTVHYTEMLRRLPAVFSGAFILCGAERLLQRHLRWPEMRALRKCE